MEPTVTSVLDPQIISNLKLLEATASTLIRDLVDLYITSTPKALNELESAVVHLDRAKIQFQAHNLKSSSANLGAHRMAEICNQVELKAQVETATFFSAKLQELASEYSVVKKALLELLMNK